MYSAISSLQRPQDIAYCVRITLGFYDPVNHFFQSKIQTDSFNCDVSSVRREIPVVTPYDGFQKYMRVKSTKWDLRIDFVAPTKQAIFVAADCVQAIANEQFLHKMSMDLTQLLTMNAEDFPHEPDVPVGFEMFP